MKKYLVYLSALASTLLIGCNSFRDMSGAVRVNPITVDVYSDIIVENISMLKDLIVGFDNCDEDLHYVKEVTNNSVKIDGIIPGIYSVAVSGTAIDTENSEYYTNGNSVNAALFKHDDTLSIGVQSLKVNLLVFKKIYYCGNCSEKGGVCFHDQFYEIYNNSADVLYLNDIYFANLTPGTAIIKLPIWPKADGNNHTYEGHVRRFPGNGTEYPLAPGESYIISQFAANRQLDIYNPQSPIDGSSSESEFNMNNPNFPDQATYNMQYVFYQGKAEMGGIPQYLTSVFKDAYVIFCVPKGETWGSVDDKNIKTTGLSKPNSNVYYAKIPVKYVLDAVGAVDNESKMNAKRVPGALDASITWVGATYCGLGIARELPTDEEGNPIIHEEVGIYIYQNTNNSVDDFEHGVVPIMRCNGAKIPSWSHTLQQSIKRVER